MTSNNLFYTHTCDIRYLLKSKIKKNYRFYSCTLQWWKCYQPSIFSLIFSTCFPRCIIKYLMILNGLSNILSYYSTRIFSRWTLPGWSRPADKEGTIAAFPSISSVFFSLIHCPNLGSVLFWNCNWTRENNRSKRRNYLFNQFLHKHGVKFFTKPYWN